MSAHEPPHDNPGVIAPPPLIFGAGGIVGLLLHALLPIRFLPENLNMLVGVLLVVLSAIPGPLALIQMLRRGTSPMPEQPTTALVTDGVFRYTRNPIYLTFTLFYLGVAALVNGLMLLVPLPVILYLITTGVIEREERYLERKFGDAYRQYRARTRRWF